MIFLMMLILTTEVSQEIEPEQYVCYRAVEPIIVDGKLNESSWKKADWTNYFVDIEGESKPKPRFKTRVKMLWDDTFFYVAAELEEPDVWGTLTKRDSVIFKDNDFEVFIDPDGDTHEYYELEINALNTVWDLLLVKPYRDGGPAVIAWDINGLKTGVSVKGSLNQPGDKDEGWSVEIGFPWKVLRECAHRDVPPLDGDQWRVNFSRVEWEPGIVDGKYQNGEYQKKLGKLENNWVWSPQGVINMHRPETWGYVQFSTKIAGTGEDKFVEYPQEEAKRFLRIIYYKQKEFYENYGRYTDSLEELRIEMRNLKFYTFPPKIQITDTMFEASITDKEDFDNDGKFFRWHIRHDSKVWKQGFIE